MHSNTGAEIVLLRVSASDGNGFVSVQRPFSFLDTGRIYFTTSAISLPNSSVFITNGYFLAPFFCKRTGELIEGISVEVMRNSGNYQWEAVSLFKRSQVLSIQKNIREMTKSLSSWRIGWLLEDGEARTEILSSSKHSQTSPEPSSSLFLASPPTNEDILHSGIDQLLYFRLDSSKASNTTLLQPFAPSSYLQQGEIIHAVGTPFGVSSPRIFYNSISKGVVSNILTNSARLPEMYLLDARISPGVEGGGIYNNKGQLCGMILPPIRRTDDVIVLNLAVPLNELFGSINIPKVKKEIIPSYPWLDKAKKSLLLLKCGSTWTSGFFISTDGLILTNGHLFANRTEKTNKKFPEVKVRFCSGEWRRASVLFVSSSVIDVALLKLKARNATESVNVPAAALSTNIAKGCAVAALGHGIWGSLHGFQPSVTEGVVSNVVHVAGQDAMLLTDIPIHKGNSGGMILDVQSGCVIGLAAFNGTIKTKHHTSAVMTIPRTNFSIPISYLHHFITFIEHRNLQSLEVYNQPPLDIQKLWALQLDPPSGKIPPQPKQYIQYLQNQAQINSKL